MIEEETLVYDSKIFNILTKKKKNPQLLELIRFEQNNDQIIQNQLIKIIKLSAFTNGIENIAGKAMSILKKITKIIKWENFQNIRLKDCSMRGISFIDCNFSGSIMENVNIDSCWFIDCCLDNVKWLNITCTEQKVIKFKDSQITNLVSSQDDSLLISSTKNNSKNECAINVHDFYSGEIQRILLTHSDINKVVPLTKEIVGCIKYNQKVLRFFHIKTWKFQYFKYKSNLYDLFSFNNGIIIIISQQIILEQFFKPKKLRRIKQNNFRALSSNGRYVAYQENYIIEVCELSRARTLQLNLKTKTEKTLFFSKNNQELAIKRQNHIYMWNIKSLQMSKRIKLPCLKKSFLFKELFSHNGQILAICQKNIITLYNIKNKQIIVNISLKENIQFSFFHPIKTILLIACYQDYIYYIDYMAKQKTIIKKGSDFDFTQLSVSYNAEFFATLNSNSQMQIFKGKNGEEVGYTDANITSIAFSPINNILAFGKTDSSVSFYDVKKNQICKTIQNKKRFGKITKIAFSPNESLIALAGSCASHIVIFDVKTGGQLQVLYDQAKYKFVNREYILFSPNEKFLASSIGKKHIRLWNLEQRTQCIKIQRSENLYKFLYTFTPDNKQFVYSFGRRMIQFLDIQSNQKVKKIYVRDQVDFIHLLNDGQYLMYSFFDGFEILDLKSERILRFFEWPDSRQPIIFSINGRKFLIKSDNGFYVWDIYYEINYHTLGKIYELPLRFLEFSHTKQMLISQAVDCNAFIYDYSKQQELKKIECNINLTSIVLIKLSKLGTLLALVTQDQVIHLLNLQTFKLQNNLEFHKNKIQAIDIQDDDQYLFACEENIIYLWDITQNKIVKIINSNLSGINDIFVSFDGQDIYCFCSKQNLYAINVHQQENQQILYQHSNIITCLKISPDRKYFIFGSLDGKILIFDLTSKTIYKEFYEHEDQIIDISFSPDENAFASVSKDEIICFWEIQYDTLLDKLNCIKGINTITFINKNLLAYGCNDGTIKTIQLWQQNIRPFNQLTKCPKHFQGYGNTVKNAEIISTQGLSLVNLIRPTF